MSLVFVIVLTQSRKGDVVILPDHPFPTGVAPLPVGGFIVVVLATAVDVLVELIELVAVSVIVSGVSVVVLALLVVLEEVVVAGAVAIRKELITVVLLDCPVSVVPAVCQPAVTFVPIVAHVAAKALVDLLSGCG